jgi:hypothetical protein
MDFKIPSPLWAEFKREMLQRWSEITEHELEDTEGRVSTITDLVEQKVGLAFEDASRKIAEMTARYHLYDEPEEEPAQITEQKKERVLELRPKKPANRDRKPKDDFRI